MIFRFARHISRTMEEKLQIDANEIKKLFLLAFSFFFIIASYSILRSLKTSIFLGLVGKEYQPMTRLIAIVIMFPAMLGYAKLVDKFKREQIVYTIIGIYAIASIIFAILLAHPTIGVQNTFTSPYRFIGWGFEIFMDLYSALVVSTFWSFVNSVCTPMFAEKGYGTIVAISKIGGIAAALIGLLITRSGLETSSSIPLLTASAGIFLLLSILLVRSIIKTIPDSYLHGYQAAFVEEKKAEKQLKKPGIFEGLRLMITEPYVLGIFGILYSMEIISIIFDYQMQVLMSVEMNNHIGSMSSFMFIYTATFQVCTFLFAFLGTSTLLKKIGVRACLIITPLVLGLLSLIMLSWPSLWITFFILVILRALNYGFNQPVREILYIPTVKDIQFKSKAWIESFGKTFSKASGSAFSWISITTNPLLCIRTNAIFSFAISAFYLVIVFFLGRRYAKTVENNEVIGTKRYKS
ncbi:hypothetical protein K2W90_03255 [Candidatus Babeliales bacterium]|nr:hypothetical protein [Candidatus Babeliales bacterium]